MTGHAVRWRKYGKDRLYVTGADGVTLGYRDLLTDRDVLTQPTRAAEFAVAVAAWVTGRITPVVELPSGNGAAVDAGLCVPQREPAAEHGDAEGGGVPRRLPAPLDPSVVAPEPVVAVAWEDLARRHAGAMAREQARALREAAPVRTFVARALGVHTDERAWRLGADGEQKVAGQLAKLARKDARWQVLHAIPVGERGSDIDHLVIGPAGVYSLNAKHHPGATVWVGGNTLLINGQRQPYIRNSRHEAARATRLLTAACGIPVVVTGVVVPVGADDITVKAPPPDVHVVNRRRLVRWLRDRPVVLSATQIDVVYDVARRSTTWRTGS